MSDQTFTFTELDVAAAAAVRVATICNSVKNGMLEGGKASMPSHHHELVCEALDLIAKCLRIVATSEIVDRNDRPAAVDLTIPDELAHVFSFIAGRSDGGLFVLPARASRLQLWFHQQDGDVYHFPAPLTVAAGQLVRLDFAAVPQ